MESFSKLIKNKVKISLTLKFAREITKTQLIEAFNDAFKDCDKVIVQSFKDTLSTCLGDGNIKKNEQILFSWLDDNSIAMFGNNVEDNSILLGNSKELNLDKITLNAKTIDLNCNNFKLKCDKIDNKNIENINLELETLKNRIINLEKRCL